MIDPKHIATLTEIAEGREAAAHAEQLVMDGLRLFVELFQSGNRTPHVMRRLRIYNDARSNKLWAEREAAAVRAALEVLQ